MTTFNRDYFRRHYPDYERQNPPRKLRWYRSLIERYCDPVQHGLRVCDIGCGGAGFISSLSAVWDRFGVDPAVDMLQAVHHRSGEALLAGGTLDLFPLKGPFDAVTLFDVLEHVPHPDDAAVTIDGLLRPGGILLFVVPVYDGPAGAAVRLLDKDPTHVNRWSRGAWLGWAEKRFEILDWLGVTRYFLTGRWYIHLPTRMWRSFTPAIAVIARKRGS